MKKKFSILLFLFPLTAFAAGDFRTTAEILNAQMPTNTECATRAFADALAANADMVNEDDSEYDVQQWVYDIFAASDTLSAVLSCPEIEDADPDIPINFIPIQYTFPGGRQIVIDYKTTPNVLNQRFLLANKTELPTDDVNPELSPTDPHATWVNTDPAWYAIMVTQAGALDEFVGPGRNNTLSMQYVYDNIDKLYPTDINGTCSTKTGIGAKLHNSMVHHVIRDRTAKHDGDKNNYYIAGGRDLRWISWAEIGLDIAMTVATFGASALATGAIKGARATKIMGKLAKNIRRLNKIDSVKDYVKHSSRFHRATRNVEYADKFASSLRDVTRLEEKLAKATRGSKKYKNIEKQLDVARKTHATNAKHLGDSAKNITKVEDLGKLDDFKKLNNKEIDEAKKLMDDLAKSDKNVAEFVKETDTLRDVSKYAKELKSIRKARTGNVFQRTWAGIKNTGKSLRAANSGTRTLDNAARVARRGARNINQLERAHIDDVAKSFKDMSRIENRLAKTKRGTAKYDNIVKELDEAKKLHAEKLAKLGPWAKDIKKLKDLDFLKRTNRATRHSIRSANVRDWLYHATRRNAARITRVGEDVAIFYTILGILGDFYDRTEVEVNNYTNGISMRPLLLLSADDLDNVETEVNYGMWLMWTGDSTNSNDDDAAYLQATDFAQKFYQDLTEAQQERGAKCNVDIFVVRPIIRNPNTDHQQLYWLIMNDEPWSTMDAD